MGLRRFLATRTATEAWQHDPGCEALRLIAAERRKAQALLDEAKAEQLAEANPGHRQSMEDAVQKLGAIVRELERSAHSLTVSLQAMRELDEVESRLAKLLPAPVEAGTAEAPTTGVTELTPE